jgi:hypothetical protein
VDTDSLIFSGEGPPLQQGLIGQLTDEILSKHGVKDTIKLFCATGPKSYGYQLKSNEIIKECKVKGITLSHQTSQALNLDSMKQLLLDMDNSDAQDCTIEVTTHNAMRRNKKTKTIKACDAVKTFRITNDKRVKVRGSFVTLPYGHEDIPEKPKERSK